VGSTADGPWNTTASGDVVHEADAVFEGGGVKGFGLAVALSTFEERGYTKWVNVAGTSAGAIMAAYIACGHSGRDAVNLMTGDMPWASFEDWGHLHGAVDLVRIHGLCRGDVFHTWMANLLSDATFGDVWDDGAERFRLKMIATDITRKKLLVLPDDLTDYRGDDGKPIDPKAYRIADAVRMSMSIPYFFAPSHLTLLDGTSCTIVDGGVLSNFPVWLFDTNPDTDPKRPTFGFFITGGKGVGGALDHLLGALGWPTAMALDIFHTASAAWDDRFHSHSTIVRTCPVPVDGLGTTDFAKVPEFIEPITRDATAAANAFLDGFELAGYRNTYGKTVA
jgi:NTE family protein